MKSNYYLPSQHKRTIMTFNEKMKALYPDKLDKEALENALLELKKWATLNSLALHLL